MKFIDSQELRILRIVRVLRPLKSLKFIPGKKELLKSIYRNKETS